MNVSLEGKVAVICGSTQGIGRAIAMEFAQAGASCMLLARNKETLEEVKAGLSISGKQEHQIFVADFTDLSQVRTAMQQITQITPVHILVNNTGGPKPGPITEASPEEFISACNQHLVCNQLLVQAFLPAMKEAAYGRIINIVSTNVKIPMPDLGVSNTIRAAVAAWAKTVSNEVGKFNITVNNILPGYTDTARLRSLIESISKRTNRDTQAIAKEMQETIPLKRFGNPSETAAVAAFLASPAASYVNGTSILVDGGKTGTI
jgi:3-oxoacyl-[acyl-carrier protein] reductase